MIQAVVERDPAQQMGDIMTMNNLATNMALPAFATEQVDRLCILVVDDDRLLRTVARLALEKEAMCVIEAESGEAALSELATQRVDLVLLDACMPGADGFSICREIRKRPDHSHLPIIMVTGLDGDFSVDAAFKAGVSDYLNKPINWSVLKKRIPPMVSAARQQTSPATLADLSLEVPTPLADAVMLLDPQGQVLGEQPLFETSYQDSATGLIKGRLFRDRAAKVLAQDHGQQRHTVLCRVVVNNVRHLLETLDDPGIQLISQQLVARLRAAIRLGGVGDGKPSITQLGGVSDQEFTVLLPEVEQLDDAVAWIRQAEMVLDEPFQVDAIQVKVSCTLCISSSTETRFDGTALNKAARLSLAARTRRGESGVVTFSPALNDEIVQHARMEALLRLDLERGRLHMNYQPKVAASDLRLLGVEALLRWNSTELGMVSPAQFIPLAEEAGLMSTLSHFVIDQVLDQLKGWRELAPPALPVAINLPGSVLTHAGVVDFLQESLQQYGLSPGQLEVEVTEDMMSDRDSQAIYHLEQLRALGVRVAIHDFGMGSSSLSYLRDLPVDVLKIDRHFVRHLRGDPTDSALVRALITMAHELGLEVVAEGVETARQLATLRELGCDVIQGFFTGKPMEAAEVLKPAVH